MSQAGACQLCSEGCQTCCCSCNGTHKTGDFDYLPFFYFRVFTCSWQFYKDNVGEVMHVREFTSGNTFRAYLISKGRLVGSFFEGGTKEEYEARATRLKAKTEDPAELEKLGLGFAMAVVEEPPPPSPFSHVLQTTSSSLVLEKLLYVWHATAGVAVATSIAAFAYRYGKKRKRW